MTFPAGRGCWRLPCGQPATTLYVAVGGALWPACAEHGTKLPDGWEPQALASAYVGDHARIHGARCNACMFGQHQQTPTPHSWADEADVAHAVDQGQPDPSRQLCACPCTTDAAFCAASAAPVEDNDPQLVSLDGSPCDVCGADKACAYDAEGRPLIHALSAEEPS